MSTRSASGKVLAGLAKRIVPTLNAASVGTPQEIEPRCRRSCSEVEDAHVRVDRQDRARHRRHRGHRRGHRPRAAQAGRDGCHLRAPAATSSTSSPPSSARACTSVPATSRNKAQVAKLIDEAIAKLGRLDILVNNAGLTKDNLFMVMKDDQWDEVIAVNLTSTFMLMRAAPRAMMRTKTRLWPHHQHLLDQRDHRQPGPGQLCSVQGRHRSACRSRWPARSPRAASR